MGLWRKRDALFFLLLLSLNLAEVGAGMTCGCFAIVYTVKEAKGQCEIVRETLHLCDTVWRPSIQVCIWIFSYISQYIPFFLDIDFLSLAIKIVLNSLLRWTISTNISDLEEAPLILQIQESNEMQWGGLPRSSASSQYTQDYNSGPPLSHVKFALHHGKNVHNGLFLNF